MERLNEMIRNEADEVLLPPLTGTVSQAQTSRLADCTQEIAFAVDGTHGFARRTCQVCINFKNV